MRQYIYHRSLSDVHTRVEMIYSKPANPSGEPFVQPKLTPPIHSDQVAEPLVSKLMCYNVSDAVSVAVSRGLGVKEDSSRATRIKLDMFGK